MSTSIEEGKLVFQDFIRTFQPQSILDVGAGEGDYEKRLNDIEMRSYVRMDAVEIYEPYIERFNLKTKYDNVFNEDILTFVDKMQNYDLIILGDIVEHLDKVDMMIMWNQLKIKSKFIWVSIPLEPTSLFPFYKGYEQLAADWAENIHEKHISKWEYNEFHGMLGPFIWSVPFLTIWVFLAQGIAK